MKKIFFGLITLITLSCNDEQPIEFSLKGNSSGMENGTALYLSYNNKIIDSTLVEGNAFEFNTKLSESPIKIWLHDKRYSNYRAFWAEDKPMTFDARESNFRNATITGSTSEKLFSELLQKTDTLPRSERTKYEIEFIKNNPNSIVSASMLSIYASTWGKVRTVELYEQLSSSNKSSKFGKEVARYIELNKEPKIGDKYVDFESENQYGELKRLSDAQGKVVLLEFWASWCGPCLQENPNLVKTYEKYKPKGFEVFAVSLDINKNNWTKEIKKGNLNWVHVSDLKGDQSEASLIYGIMGIPDNFLIDANGVIIGRNLRGDQLNQALEKAL